jgi:hypothetical protein
MRRRITMLMSWVMLSTMTVMLLMLMLEDEDE